MKHPSEKINPAISAELKEHDPLEVLKPEIATYTPESALSTRVTSTSDSTKSIAGIEDTEIRGEAAEILGLLQKDVLEAYRREFDYLSSTFRDLDSKAQGSSSIAGIFLAAVLAFVNRQGMMTLPILRGAAALGVICLIGSLIYSLQALTIRLLTRPPSGEDFERLLRDLRAPSAAADIRARGYNFYGDISGLWLEIVKERREINLKKASYIRRSQGLLAISAVFATLIILLVLSKG